MTSPSVEHGTTACDESRDPCHLLAFPTLPVSHCCLQRATRSLQGNPWAMDNNPQEGKNKLWEVHPLRPAEAGGAAAQQATAGTKGAPTRVHSHPRGRHTHACAQPHPGTADAGADAPQHGGRGEETLALPGGSPGAGLLPQEKRQRLPQRPRTHSGRQRRGPAAGRTRAGRAVFLAADGTGVRKAISNLSEKQTFTQRFEAGARRSLRGQHARPLPDAAGSASRCLHGRSAQPSRPPRRQGPTTHSRGPLRTRHTSRT